MAETEILRLTDVSKQYESGGPAPLRVLRGVGLAVRAGESLAVCGPSGSGKTTLLNIVGGNRQVKAILDRRMAKDPA